MKNLTAEGAKSFLVGKPDCGIAARNGVERMDSLDGGLSPNLIQCSNLKVSPTGPLEGCSIRPVGESFHPERASYPERAMDLCWFEDLAIGDCFISHFPPGAYFKTGTESYGIAPGEPSWGASDMTYPVRAMGRGEQKLIAVDFGTELPPLPGCGALKEAA